MTTLLLYSLIAGLFSLVGGFLLLLRPNITKNLTVPLISFGTGAFLAAAFLDILPAALEASEKPQPILTATLVGFLSFFFLERYIMKHLAKAHRSHHHHEHTESLSFLIILGDCIHNFLDGVVIALAFAANPGLGLTATLAIAAHEIPQEIGDFSVLLHLGWKKSKVLTVNIVQSLCTIPGVLIGYYLGQRVESQLPILLGVTAGIFIYISASDLIPELHHQAGHHHIYRVVIPMIISVLLVAKLIGLAHGQG
jgi:zinc and cadmium transporter